MLPTNSLFLITAIGCATFLPAFSAPATLSSASTPAVAWSPGVLRINGSDHSGSGNIFPGSQLDTLRSAGSLYLADGSRLRLAASTRLSVDSQDIHLHSGSARIDAIPTTGLPLHVLTGVLSIAATGGVIRRPQPNEIIVTAESTTTEVRRMDGMLVALVRPGQTLSFAVPHSAQSRSLESSLTGRVQAQGGQFFLTDETTNLKTELQGVNADPYRGKRVQAHGELIPDSTSDRSKFVVKQYAMLQTQPETNSQSDPNAKPKGNNPAAPAATGTAPGTTPTVVVAATGLTKTAIGGIIVAVGAGIGTSIGFIAANSESTISK